MNKGSTAELYICNAGAERNAPHFLKNPDERQLVLWYTLFKRKETLDETG